VGSLNVAACPLLIIMQTRSSLARIDNYQGGVCNRNSID
jgi:hypothetical protein